MGLATEQSPRPVSQPQQQPNTMDANKKKMQAMKVEKDNAMDRSDVCEQASKDAKVRAGKAEEEVEELIKKSQQLEVELDKTMEELLTTTEKLKEKENSLSSAELEVAALNRRVQGIEGDLETCEDKLLLASQKLDKAAGGGAEGGGQQLEVPRGVRGEGQ